MYVVLPSYSMSHVHVYVRRPILHECGYCAQVLNNENFLKGKIVTRNLLLHFEDFCVGFPLQFIRMYCLQKLKTKVEIQNVSCFRFWDSNLYTWLCVLEILHMFLCCRINILGSNSSFQIHLLVGNWYMVIDHNVQNCMMLEHTLYHILYIIPQCTCNLVILYIYQANLCRHRNQHDVNSPMSKVKLQRFFIICCYN